MTADDFQRFGDPASFALDVRLTPDPDPDERAPAASVGSWGQWRLWAGGLNLSEHELRLDSGELLRRDCVTWYLAPLFHWIAEAWVPMLHEARLPEGGGARGALNAREAYLGAWSVLGGEIDQFADWHGWARRHSLRRASDGGVLPDVFLRRLEDEIEISWGDRLVPGGEAFSFVSEGGVTHQAVAVVAEALGAALAWFTEHEAFASRRWLAELRRLAERCRKPSRPDAFLAWYLDARPTPGKLTALYKEARKSVSAWKDLVALPRAGTFVERFTPAVAMFGSIAPEISEAAAARLIAIAADAAETTPKTRPVDRFVEPLPAWQGGSPWSNGYALAQELADEAELVPDGDRIAIDVFVEGAGVTLRRARLGRNGPRGVALAGEGFTPTIVVNVDHPFNSVSHGARFTIAHELCHVLHDRDRARRLTHSSAPWAPPAVEQRANAFAAMLLMPSALCRRLLPARVTLAAVAAAAERMGVGLRSALQHLANIGEISDMTRDQLLAELDAAAAEKFA